MRKDDHARSANKKWWASRRVLLVGLLLAILTAVGFARAYLTDYARIKEITQLEQEAKRLEEKKVSLLELMKYVQTDAYVEEEARTKLQMKKPGEDVIVFSDLKPNTNVSVAPIMESNLKKWWRYFFEQ